MKQITRLNITIIDPKTQIEKRVTNYEFMNGHLIIPELGCAYFLLSQMHIDFTKPFYYQDSVFPIDEPDKQIIRKYIKVEVMK